MFAYARQCMFVLVSPTEPRSAGPSRNSAMDVRVEEEDSDSDGDIDYAQLAKGAVKLDVAPAKPKSSYSLSSAPSSPKS